MALRQNSDPRTPTLAIAATAASLLVGCGSPGGFRIDGSPIVFDGGCTNCDATMPPGADRGSIGDDGGPPSGDAGPSGDGEVRNDAAPGSDAEPGADAEPGMDAPAGVDTGPIANPSPLMTFFVTSVGNGPNGGNFGGLAGADARCQSLAAAVGLGRRTWRAYLSTSDAVTGGILVHARDRIGTGPWFNFYGDQVAASVDLLHSAGLNSMFAITEAGRVAPTNEHDILTGTEPDGTDRGNDTCENWTSSADTVTAFVGHSDWSLPGAGGVLSWNSAHRTNGCSQAALASTAGSGRLYCFAID